MQVLQWPKCAKISDQAQIHKDKQLSHQALESCGPWACTMDTAKLKKEQAAELAALQEADTRIAKFVCLLHVESPDDTPAWNTR